MSSPIAVPGLLLALMLVGGGVFGWFHLRESSEPSTQAREEMRMATATAPSAATQTTAFGVNTIAPPLRSITIGTATVHVSVADTPAARERGLGGRTELAPDEGMLFVFPVSGRYAFWMKDMHFSIDIIWLDASGAVVYVAPSVAPGTYPQAFTPPLPALYVLEVPAGFAAQHDIDIGAKAAL